MGRSRKSTYSILVYVFFVVANSKEVRIANLGYHTADIIRSLIEESFQVRGISSSRFNVDNSKAALLALSKGEVDVVPECWYNCTYGGNHVRQLGAQGREAIYVPSYMVELQPHVQDWTNSDNMRFLAASGITLIGPPAQYACHAVFRDLAAQLHLRMTTPKDFQELTDLVLDSMKMKRPFAFYYWEPHPFTASYDVVRVNIPNNSNKCINHWLPLYLVWSQAIDNEPAGAVLASDVGFHLEESVIRKMLRGIATRVSLKRTGTAYHQAVQATAADILCHSRDIFRDHFCAHRDSLWPREKSPSLPAELRILTKECPGFSNCHDESGNQLDRPIDGYAIDQLQEVLRLLGYKESDYVIDCYHGGGGANEVVERTGMELYDLAQACITVSSTRSLLVDFSNPFYSTGLGILVRKDDTLTEEDTFRSHMAFFFAPFHWTTWVTYFAIILLVGLSIGFFEGGTDFYTGPTAEWVVLPKVLPRHWSPLPSHRSPPSQGSNRTTSFSFLKKASPLKVAVLKRGRTGIAQRASLRNGTNLAVSIAMGVNKDLQHANSMEGKLCIGLLSLIAKLFMAFYTANLASQLFTNSIPQPVISGIQDMNGRRAGILCNTTVESWLRKYKRDVRLVCFPTYDEQVAAVRAKTVDAAIHDATVLERIAAQDCELQVVGGLFAYQDYAVVLPKEHPLLEPLSQAVTHLKEENVHDRLYQKYFSTDQCMEVIEPKKTGIRPEKFVGFLTLVAVCICASFLNMCYTVFAHNCGEPCSGKDVADGSRQDPQDEGQLRVDEAENGEAQVQEPRPQDQAAKSGAECDTVSNKELTTL